MKVKDLLNILDINGLHTVFTIDFWYQKNDNKPYYLCNIQNVIEAQTEDSVTTKIDDFTISSIMPTIAFEKLNNRYMSNLVITLNVSNDFRPGDYIQSQ